MKSIDLNADLGEGFPLDLQLLDIVSSASIACGGHAGSDQLMQVTLRAAGARGVRIGAHPGFEDPEHFGRRELDLPHPDIADQVLRQIARLFSHANNEGQPVAYLKLHGALYNMAARDPALASFIFQRVQSEFGNLPIMALAGTAQIEEAETLGLPVIREGFADRTYDENGQLVPRNQPNAVLHDPSKAVAQAVALARDGKAVSVSGKTVRVNVQSICLHGDNESALDLAKAVRQGLNDAGISITADA